LLDCPFTRRKRTCKVCLRFQRCHIYFSGVIDTAEIVSVVSMKPRKFEYNRFSRRNSAKNSVFNVPKKFFTLPTPWYQRYKWHRWNSNIIDFLGEYEAICETALGRESGPKGGLFDEKNRGSKIACYCPFKCYKNALKR
jgi:hypothetical protein